MTQQTPSRCQVINGVIETCYALNDAIHWYGRLGLQYHILSNIKTGEESRTFVAVHSGKWAKKGIVAMFCPFCGESIGQHMEPEEDK